MTKHKRDSRAAIAAFTKGRVLSRQLKKHRSAAKAFAAVQTLRPNAALAEDALAREVEAWKRAGKRKQATARAKAYIERFPKGHRLEIVKRHGGLR